MKTRTAPRPYRIVRSGGRSLPGRRALMRPRRPGRTYRKRNNRKEIASHASVNRDRGHLCIDLQGPLHHRSSGARRQLLIGTFMIGALTRAVLKRRSAVDLSLWLPAPGPLPLASLPDRNVDSGPEGDGAVLGRRQQPRTDPAYRPGPAIHASIRRPGTPRRFLPPRRTRPLRCLRLRCRNPSQYKPRPNSRARNPTRPCPRRGNMSDRSYTALRRRPLAPRAGGREVVPAGMLAFASADNSM